MNTRPSLYPVILLNLALLALALAQQFHPALAQQELPLLRGRALEIVDPQGRVRASITVLPATKSSSGERLQD
jgi:hypothetical protein